MNVLYITSVWNGLNTPNMHVDFLNEAARRGHQTTVLALSEKRNKEKTKIHVEKNITILTVRCGNIQKTNKYTKVISSLLANYQIVQSTRRFIKNNKYDVVIWAVSTTLIYFGVRRITKMFKCKQYLLLKEYWPQDPVDLGAMRENGIVYKFFKHVEKKMFDFTDRIGVSSPAGIQYIVDRYPMNKMKCEVCPHCEESRDITSNRNELFKRIGIDTNKFTFVYGGNLGISQGPNDVVCNISTLCDIDSISILFLGSGTEFEAVKKALNNQKNVYFLPPVNYFDFFNLSSCCDCGLIFLYSKYKVPNIPAKFNTYLNCEIPVLACIDRTTDLGKIIVDNNVGLSVFSEDHEMFREIQTRCSN